MKLSVVLIVKNEECCLEKCLESVKDADEIIICDTGSTDKTLDIASKFTKSIYHFKWCDDFSAARNYAKSFATGDWIFSIDADHVLNNSISQMKRECLEAQLCGQKAALVRAVRADSSHWMAALFKNLPEIKWEGACHEVLNISTNWRTLLNMTIGRSKTHDVDPERNLRILLNEFPLDQPRTPRNKFYLGRTYFEMGRYESAIFWLKEYLPVSTWLQEKADAYYVIAKCLWLLNKGNEARPMCLCALEINANFKKAHLLMSEMSWPKNAVTWKRFAELATNEDVLFT